MADDPIDRSRLPIADPELAGVANRTLEGSPLDWGLIVHVAPPEGAPNIMLVLIDDAGFGQPAGVGCQPDGGQPGSRWPGQRIRGP
jgi:hypothetical protein